MIAIVGGGPAALGAAIACGKHALVLERNPGFGYKLLLSGSGQCNFSNARSTEEFLSALGSFRNWLKPAFFRFDNRALINLLEENGCPVFVRADGKVFPESMRSEDVLETLLKIARSNGAELSPDTPISSVAPTSSGFVLHTERGTSIHAQQLIIASGGASWPHTGSDGSSYRFAKSLGHTTLSARPALASLEIKDYSPFVKCAGISLKAKLRFSKVNKSGDLLFTHKGFSGPLILDNSWQLEAGQTIRIGFSCGSGFQDLVLKNPKRRVVSLLKVLSLPQSFAQALFEYLKISPDLIAAELSSGTRNLIVNWLSDAHFTIAKVEGLASSMSDFGGVDLKEVDAKTMQSRLLPKLFFAGESLAYSLPSGGFSIQMAFSTGYLAGLSAMNSI